MLSAFHSLSLPTQPPPPGWEQHGHNTTICCGFNPKNSLGSWLLKHSRNICDTARSCSSMESRMGEPLPEHSQSIQLDFNLHLWVLSSFLDPPVQILLQISPNFSRGLVLDLEMLSLAISLSRRRERPFPSWISPSRSPQLALSPLTHPLSTGRRFPAHTE